MKISIILPTYNEAENITYLIDDILKYFEDRHNEEPEIIVVDDDSPDKTAQIVNDRYSGNRFVKCLVRKNEKGLSTAIKFGILNSTGSYILFMDADGNHDPKNIPIFLDLVKYHDAAMGSRFGWGGGMDASKFRYWGSYVFNLFLRVILRLKSRDNTSGYLIVKKQIIDGFDLENIFKGYGEWFFSLLYALKNKGATLAEVSIYYPKRRGGDSKTNFFRYFFTYSIKAFQLRFKKKDNNLKKKNKFKNSFIIFFIASVLFGAVFFNLSDFIIGYKNYSIGNSYNFFSFVNGDAQSVVVPGYRDILDGNWRGSDGMTYENLDMPAIRPFFNYWVMSPLILLFKSYNAYFLVGRFLVAIISFLFAYKLAKHLIKDKIWSTIFSFILTVGGVIFYFLFPTSIESIKILIRTFSFFGSPPVEIMPGRYNSVSILPGLAFFSATFLFLYLMIIKNKRYYKVLAGIFLGLVINNYPTSGIYFWIICGIMLFLFLILKNFNNVKKILWVYIISAFVAIPVFINQIAVKMLPWSEEIYWRVGGEMTNAFRFSQWPNYLAFIIFAIFLWRWGTVKNRKTEAVYLISLALAPIAALNIQIIIGINPVGWDWFDHQFYFGFAFGWLVLLHWAYELILNKANKVRFLINFLLILMVSIFALRMVHTSIAKASYVWEYHYIPQEVKDSFSWLNKNTEVNSVVATPSVVNNLLLSSDTHNRILLSAGTNSSLSQKEILDRLYVLYSIFNVSPDYLELALRSKLPVQDNFAGGSDNALFPLTFYYYFVDKSLDSLFESMDMQIPEDELKKIINEYKAYPRRMCYLLTRYKVDYLYLGSLEKEIVNVSDISLINLELFKKVYNGDNIDIYRIDRDLLNSKCK